MRNQLIQGQFDESGCGFLRQSNGLRYEDRYVFAAQANERISFTVQTPLTYPTLELYDPQGRRLAFNFGKRLPANAGELVLPSSGTYSFVISSQSKGDYQLLATDSSACTFTVTPDPLVLSAANGKRTMQVTASRPHCAWTARSTATWLALSGEGQNASPFSNTFLYTGSRALEFDVSANTGLPRFGYLHLADRVVTIKQEARQLIPTNEPLAVVNAATYATGTQAPDALVAAFGKRLATASRAAAYLTTALADTTVNVTDTTGLKRSAFLLFVSPTQVNFVMPAGTATGLALVEIISGDNSLTSTTLAISNVAPGVFSANATGKGWANGLVLRVKADQSQAYEPLVQYDARTQDFVPQPIVVNQPDEKVFLVLFGTGWRWRNDLANVTARVGSLSLPVQYCGASDARYVGLDQLNLELPASLAGSGKLTLELTVEGQNANPLQFVIK